MASKAVARGRALLQKLRRDEKVRDPERLAGWIAARKRGPGSGSGKSGGSSGAPAGKDRKTTNVFGKKSTLAEDDDPFAEDHGDDEVKSKEDRQRERMEAQLIRQMEKADRAKVHNAIRDQGGLKTNASLREEYAGIPNTFKRRDGMAGDEMADHLAMYYPELGIESERDLIDYLAA